MGDVDRIRKALEQLEALTGLPTPGLDVLDRLTAALASEAAINRPYEASLRTALATAEAERDEARARRLRTYKIAHNLRCRVVAQRHELALKSEELRQVQRNREWAQEHAQKIRAERDAALAELHQLQGWRETVEPELVRLRAALERIAEYGHKPGCDGCAPVYECCGGGEDWPSQAEIARAALDGGDHD